VKTLLQIEPDKRTHEDIEQLKHQFETNAFLVRQATELRDPVSVQSLFTHLRLAEYKAGETVFRFGDRGQLFYIIIDGEVDIRTPAPIELQDDQLTPEGLLVFCLTYFNDVNWQSITNGEKVKQRIIKELQNHTVAVLDSKFNTQDAIRALDRALA